MLSVAESKGIKSDLIPKIATGFCGGMSHTDGMCGAISGGILALNMINGRSDISDPREDLEEKVQDLISTFKNNFNSINCYELTGCDLGTDEGQEKYNINECYELCDNFVAQVTDKTLELLDKK
ncbi:MAG: C-GCAxxG-C-C family protein [Candidatus Neomarinimicrobiota bacterium]